MVEAEALKIMSMVTERQGPERRVAAQQACEVIRLSGNEHRRGNETGVISIKFVVLKQKKTILSLTLTHPTKVVFQNHDCTDGLRLKLAQRMVMVSLELENIRSTATAEPRNL